jgi:hypothetical protein
MAAIKYRVRADGSHWCWELLDDQDQIVVKGIEKTDVEPRAAAMRLAIRLGEDEPLSSGEFK